MIDPSQLAMLFAHQLVAYVRGHILHSATTTKSSVVLLLKEPIVPAHLHETNVRRAVASMDFGLDGEGAITIDDLDVKSYRVKTPFGGMAVHTTAVVMLIDSEHRVLPLKVTLSSEFAGFEVASRR
jgi:hypothetical protein